MGIISSPTILVNILWFILSLAYGGVIFYLFLLGPYDGGIVLTVIIMSLSILLVFGSVQRVRTSNQFKILSCLLMIVYGIDGLYHNEELLLSLFLLFASGAILYERLISHTSK